MADTEKTIIDSSAEPSPPAGLPRLTARRCTGCGRCVSACPHRLFTLQVSGYRKHAVLTSAQSCDLCLRCVEGCPVGALVVGGGCATDGLGEDGGGDGAPLQGDD